jgi:hypothetical protein
MVRLRFINSASVELMVCIALSISGGTEDRIIGHDPASPDASHFPTIGANRKDRHASITIIIVPMMRADADDADSSAYVVRSRVISTNGSPRLASAQARSAVPRLRLGISFAMR